MCSISSNSDKNNENGNLGGVIEGFGGESRDVFRGGNNGRPCWQGTT